MLRVKKTHFGEKTSVYLGGIGPDRRWDAWKGRGQEHKTVRATITANRKCNVFAVPKETFRNREYAE